MKTSDFDYHLPPELIAQTPAEPRDRSRLMVLSRGDGSIEHRRFFEIIEFLRPGDVLVFNDSRVIPARVFGHKRDGGGRVELLLLKRLESGVWEALARAGRRLSPGTVIELGEEEIPPTRGEVIGRGEGGVRVIRFSEEEALERLGNVPLPPYIHAPLSDPERYQTVYSRVKGSVAAPTAGLHFTPELLEHIHGEGIRFAFVTLHVWLDSFRPIRDEDPREHHMHREYCEISEEVSHELTRAKNGGGRIICVGTTSVRAVEHAALEAESSEEPIRPFRGWTNLLILPGHSFQMVDGLITNFHLPRSTLLMLVSAFAGREFTQRAYEEAIALGYRFYSFGDAMLVL